MKVAISHWQGRVSPVFDVAAKAIIIEISEHRETGREHVEFAGRAPLERAKILSRLNTDVLICGAISRSLEKDLVNTGIQVIGFVCGGLEEVLAAFKTGRLNNPCFCMPGTRKSQTHQHSEHDAPDHLKNDIEEHSTRQ